MGTQELVEETREELENVAQSDLPAAKYAQILLDLEKENGD
jgi:hypothetical protein